MRIRTSPRYLALLLLAFLLLCIACDDDDSTQPDPPEPTDVAGLVVKGPVSGAQVEIRALGSDGRPGDLILDPITTAADGSWSATIPASETGDHFLVYATGGTYTDEATDMATDVPAGTGMIGYIDRNRPTMIAVTPLTHMLHLQTLAIVADVGAATAWQRAIETATADNSFGFDPTTTQISWDPAASGAEKAYAAMLGGLSFFSKSYGITRDLSGTPPFHMAMGIVTDLADGALDGRDIGGEAIEVPTDGTGTTFEALPALSTEGIEPFNEHVHQYVDETADLAGADITEDMVVFPPSGGPGDYDCDDLDALRSAAYSSLANTLFATMNGPEPDAPRDVDFSDCRNLYRAVLECDSGDPEAHFALTILDLTALSQDPEVNDAFDEWDAYLDQMVPFEVEVTGDKLAVPNVLSSGNGPDLPLSSIQRSLIPYLNLQKAVAPPQIDEVQDILRNEVLPRVLDSIDHMDAVIAETGFTFSISPRMQGDLNEETRTADRTDFLALRAALHSLEAGLRVAISYNVALTEHTGDALMQVLGQSTGDLLTLQDDGASQMQQVLPALTAAADDLDEAIDSLIAETDAAGPGDQDDDLLKIGPQDLHRDDILEFQSLELQMIIDGLSGPVTRTYDWDFDEDTPDVSLTVDLNAFFDDPVEDFKDLLPPYTLSKRVVPFNDRYHHGTRNDTVQVTVPEAGHYEFQCDVSFSGSEETHRDSDVPAWAESAVETLIQDGLARFVQHPDYAFGRLEIYFWRTLDAGPQEISMHVSHDYTTVEAFVEVVDATFAAESFGEWLSQWPDPTLNGLFPDVMSAEEVTDAFGWEEWDWSNTFSLDWAFDDFGFLDDEEPIDPPGK